MSIPKQIWEALHRDIVAQWGFNTIDDVLDDLVEQYPDYRQREQFEKRFVQAVDQYIDAAVEDLGEDQLLQYLQEPGVWRQVMWTKLNSFTDTLDIELEDWLRRYIKAEVEYVD